MEFTEMLSNPIIEQIVVQQRENDIKKKKASYNLFTISSTNSYLENFHSDIIASLLNPKGLHEQGYTFLHKFISYLNEHYSTNLKISDFENTIVSRETGRLDIWIRDETSKQSIIIENKINNASDMLNQLDRYFDYAENGRKYSVKAVVYLSLDGYKKAPPTIEDFGHLVKNIGAFTNTKNDLINGWLRPSLEVTTINIDSSSVIHQYINLIQHLANKNMDTITKESFYQFLSINNAFETVNTIIELNNQIWLHRANKLSDSIEDSRPFKNRFYYPQGQSLIFEKFINGDNFYKLDIEFRNNGNASVIFWNYGIQGINGRKSLNEILVLLDYLKEFDDTISHGGNGYRKDFIISDKYPTMVNLDNAVIDFVKSFLLKLQETI